MRQPQFPVTITLSELAAKNVSKLDRDTILAICAKYMDIGQNKPYELSKMLDSGNVEDCLAIIQFKPEYFKLWRQLSVILVEGGRLFIVSTGVFICSGHGMETHRRGRL